MPTERLSALDASFLTGENESAPMNVGGVDVFSGPAPSIEEFTEHVEGRLHLLPRFRQRIASVPLGLGRPRWTDDTKFRLSYHLRHTALPAPGGVEQLATLFARILEQPLDRARPLWELWLVEGLEGGRFAVLHKFHHTLVDGIASVSVMQTLFDAERDPQGQPEPRTWAPQRGPSRARLIAGAAAERAAPPELIDSLGTLVRQPRKAAERTAGAVAGLGTVVGRGALRFAPRGPYNRKVGPHRRFAWQSEALDDFKAVKDALEGSLNDVVLAAVAGALGAHLRGRGEETAGLELQVFVPVALRSSSGEDTGNEVSGLRVPLPVGMTDPIERFERINAAMQELKDSAEVLAGSTVIELSGFAPPAVGDRLSQLGDVQRYVNLVVTNVPGPSSTLYLLGRELEAVFPLVPLGANLGLGVAIVSYAGGIFFGFTSDPEIVPDVGALPSLLHEALEELVEAAGVELSAPARGVGDTAAGREPWPGYDEQTAEEIRRTVPELDTQALARVRDYERENKDRKGVREALESRSA
jgi:WS/DGAT/MGAT family acyltransferase